MQKDNFHAIVDGVRLACQHLVPDHSRLCAGAEDQADAPTIILLHEALGTIRMWRDFPQRLANATGLSCLVYERRGHGTSDPQTVVPRPIDFHNEETDRFLHGLISSLKLKNPILFGHSDGATIALKYAARFPTVPRAVISLAAHVFVEDVTIDGIEMAARTYASTDWKSRLERHHFDQTNTVFRAWVDTWRQPAFRDWQMIDELPAITCPALILQGDDDQFGSDEQVTTIAHHVSGPVTSHIIPSCGHIPHLESPAAVLESVRHFLDTYC
ncbi:alpha/beta fold hydrolase [Thalassospira sp. TSL5-1]|uniref:alpha/beta fold hydrolase n=1 Tax=Thalassospira sp. TSL5-1 TaxID=1544451 RepID=UPI000938DBB0|nr:alpha/beta hydrolase [Thalassospira sp. TSL5-1]OKH88035.1 alpha/beta hydrolase [Thalassospira sp. TSL5-1]